MEHVQGSKRTADLLANIAIIDVDTHFSEPHDLWTSRASPGMRDRVPQVKTIDGKLSWVIDGSQPIGFGASAASVVRPDGSKARGLDFLGWSVADVHPGSYDLEARLKIMDEMNIRAQIVYPNVLGFGGQNGGTVDPALRLLSTQIYNDAMAEMQERSNKRFFPMALLPWWNVNLAVAETKRMHALGLRGININSDPHTHKGLPDLGDLYWDPLWQLCTDLTLPVNFHIGASDIAMDWFGEQPWPSHVDDMKFVIGGTMMFFGNARVMGNILCCGLLDRFPDLKFVSVESGIGWVPFLLEALDYQLMENFPNFGRYMQLKPSEYFARNFAACFWFENRNLANSVRAVGVDNVMFETDFPHPTCIYPESADHIRSGLAALNWEERQKILSGNAARLYNIPL
jgi:uncharacterized protein